MLSFPCLLKSALPSTKFGWSSYHPTSDNGRHGSILKRRIKRIGRIQGINPKYVPDVSPPWALTFDLRERETLWTDQNQARLVQFIASDRLGISREELQKRVTELSILLPDMGKNPSPNYYLTDTLVSRYSSLKPDLLADILQDIDRIALKIIDLKKAFPNTNISAMAARHPAILLEDIRNVLEQAKKTEELLGLERLDELIEQFPLFLDASAVDEVLTDLARLMPGDAKQHLIKNPSLLFSTVRGKKRLGEPADT